MALAFLCVVDLRQRPQCTRLGEEDGGMSKDHDSSPVKDRPAVTAKKPYQKPDFRFERVFETTALACNTKHNAGSQGCAHPFKS